MPFEHAHVKNSYPSSPDGVFLGCFQKKLTLQVKAILTCFYLEQVYLSSALCIVDFVVVLAEQQFQEKTEKFLQGCNCNLSS